MAELNGKVAIVTGAGRLRGIGRGTAVALAKLGADVVVTGTGRDPLSYPADEKSAGWNDIASTANQIRSYSVNALPLVVDVSNETHVDDMIKTVMRKYGRIDILVNNAAYKRGPDRVPITELDSEIFQRVVDVKVMGGFLCSKAVAQIMIEQGQGGSIVFVSSGSGKIGNSEALAYNAACFAQVGMTQTLAKELGHHGINVNCVCPGAVDTSRVDDIGRGGKWKDIESGIPIRRAGTDDEVGGFIAHLCITDSSWIHGQSINLNGGSIMTP